jgi:hypothetical protein
MCQAHGSRFFAVVFRGKNRVLERGLRPLEFQQPHGRVGGLWFCVRCAFCWQSKTAKAWESPLFVEPSFVVQRNDPLCVLFSQTFGQI